MISPREHHKWFKARLQDEKCAIFIIENKSDTPIGQVRFEGNNENEFNVSYSLSGQFRSKKNGKPMLEAAVSLFLNQKPDATIIARVKKDNIPSQKVLEAVGFQLSENHDQEGQLKYYLSS